MEPGRVGRPRTKGHPVEALEVALEVGPPPSYDHHRLAFELNRWLVAPTPLFVPSFGRGYRSKRNYVRSNEAKTEQGKAGRRAHQPLLFFQPFKVQGSIVERNFSILLRNILLSIYWKIDEEEEFLRRRRVFNRVNGSEFIPLRALLSRLRPRRTRPSNKKKKIRFINAADFWTKDRTRPG